MSKTSIQESEIKYYKDTEGLHFYKVSEDQILHICANMGPNDIESVKTNNRVTSRSVIEKNSYCISNLSKFDPMGKLSSSEEEFNLVLNMAIFEFGIYVNTQTQKEDNF